MFSLQLSLVSVADNSHFCLFHINPYAKHKIHVEGLRMCHHPKKVCANSFIKGSLVEKLPIYEQDRRV